jgi:hypothetical protein
MEVTICYALLRVVLRVRSQEFPMFMRVVTVLRLCTPPTYASSLFGKNSAANNSRSKALCINLHKFAQICSSRFPGSRTFSMFFQPPSQSEPVCPLTLFSFVWVSVVNFSRFSSSCSFLQLLKGSLVDKAAKSNRNQSISN